MSASALAGLDSIDALLIVGFSGSVDQAPADVECRRNFFGLMPLPQQTDDVLPNLILFVL